MSVNDEKEYPWLVQEKKILKKAIVASRTVLGICLGAQMIASAFGNPVRKGKREIGWCRIQGCATNSAPVFQDNLTDFQWHRETVDLPGGACLIAEGSEVKNQAFCLGNSVGVQFHPEVTMQVISTWAQDLSSGMDVSRILEDLKTYIDENKRRCYAPMDAFTRGWRQ